MLALTPVIQTARILGRLFKTQRQTFTQKCDCLEVGPAIVSIGPFVHEQHMAQQSRDDKFDASCCNYATSGSLDAFCRQLIHLNVWAAFPFTTLVVSIVLAMS